MICKTQLKERRKVLSIMVVAATLFSQLVEAQQGLSVCDSNLELLRQDLVSMLNKMSAMPPVATIYRPTRDLYEEAKSAKARGDYVTCVDKTSLALKYSKPYGNRY